MMISIKSTENTLLSIMDFYCESQQAGMNTNNFAAETDVLLIMNDGIIPVHAIILTSVSPFFESIFASQGPNYVGMREVLLPDFSVSIMSSVVKLIYSQEVYLKNKKEATEVLQAMNSFYIRTSENISLKLHQHLILSNQEIRQSISDKANKEILVYGKNKSSKSESQSCVVKNKNPNTNLITPNQEINNTPSTEIPTAQIVPKKSQIQSNSISCKHPTEPVDKQRKQNIHVTKKCINKDSVVDKTGSSIPVIRPSHKNQLPDSCQQSHYNASTKQPPSKRIKLLEEQLSKEQLTSLKDCIVRPHKKDGKTYVFVFRKKSREKN